MHGNDNSTSPSQSSAHTTDSSGATAAPAALVSEVIKVIVNAVNLHHLPEESITAQTSLRDGGLELDSIDILEVVVAIEHHFAVKVGDAEVAREHFRNIGKIASYIQTLRNAG